MPQVEAAVSKAVCEEDEAMIGAMKVVYWFAHYHFRMFLFVWPILLQMAHNFSKSGAIDPFVLKYFLARCNVFENAIRILGDS